MAGDIEVGTSLVGGGLRFALAGHAVRHGELRLASQVASLAGLQARATQLMSWSITGATALVVATLSTAWRVPAGVTSATLMVVAATCLGVLLPRYWNAPGYNPRILIDATYGTELEVLKSLALGYAAGIEANEAAMNDAVGWLRIAWIGLALAPLLGLAALLLTGLPAIPDVVATPG